MCLFSVIDLANMLDLKCTSMFISSTCDMAVTKQKKKRLFMGLCTFENQLGWVPVHAVMFGVNEQEEPGFGRSLGTWILDNLEVRNAYFGRCVFRGVKVRILTKVKDAIRKPAVVGKNLKKTLKALSLLKKKTLPNTHTRDFDLSKRSTELMVCFLNVECISVLNCFFEVLRPNGQRANEMPNCISEDEELDF